MTRELFDDEQITKTGVLLIGDKGKLLAPGDYCERGYKLFSGGTDTKVEYLGKLGDRGCSQTTVQTPDPPVSLKYRFTIYFPSELPATNAYPITLVGFNP